MPKLKNTKKSDWEIINGVSAMGYRDDSPYRNMRSIDIYTPNGLIDMSETGIPLMANGRYLPPYSGMHKFDETVVKETPLPEAGSGYKVVRSSERKGKTHKVIGPDGTVKFFGDSKLGQHPKDPARKKAFYARHAKNLKNNPYFRAFARKTWEEGGELDFAQDGLKYGYNWSSQQVPTQQVVNTEDYTIHGNENLDPVRWLKGAVDIGGLFNYPLSIAGAAKDAYQGDYTGAALGLIPVLGKAGIHGSTWRKAYTKAINAGIPHKYAFPLKKYGKEATILTTKGTQGVDLYGDIQEKGYGGMLPDLMQMAAGGQFLTVGGEYHRIYKNAEGDIMVNHPKEDKGKWDTINLTDKAGAKTVADGVAATKKWHRENPYAFGGNIILEKYQDGGNSLEGDLYSKILMNRNRNKDFVKRAYAVGQYPGSNMFTEFADFDTRQSHKMGWGEDESGQAYMFPTIMNPGNEAIPVPNMYADYISSQGYKNAAGIKYKNGGSTWEILPEAQTGKKITLDVNTLRPNFSNSNENIQQEIQKKDDLLRRSVGTKANPKMLPEIAITAKRQLDPSKKAFGTVYPDRTGSSAELASALFVTPLMETLHTPSRLVNQGISLYQGKGFAPYSSEISETLGWQNNDPTDLWASTRNFVADNVFDVLIPIEGVSQPSARFLTNLGEGVVEGAEAYGRSLGNTKRILRDYRLNQTPNFITPQNEELLSTVRNVGMSLKGEGDLYNPKILQNVLNRANSLNNTQFKNLTGFEKSEIEERIQKLLTGELKKPEPVASPTVDGLTREEFIRQQLIDLRRPERRQRLQELSTNIGRQNPTGWQTIESNITRPGDYDIDVINNSVDISRIAAEPNMFLHYYNEPNFNIVDKFNEKITERLNKKLGLIEKTEKPIDTKSLISGLYAREGEGAVRKKLLQAIKQVEGAKKGETFLASTSLSSDSYPLAHKFLPKMLKEGKVDVSYHGMQDLNPLGFANELGLPKNITLEEINTVIDNINKASGKRFPYAKIENKSIQVPIISATRKKFGGKVSKWEIVDDNEWEII